MNSKQEKEMEGDTEEGEAHSSPLIRGALREFRGVFCRKRKRKNLGASTLTFFFRRSAVETGSVVTGTADGQLIS